MVAEFGLEVMPITGSMFNILLRGRMIRDTRPELLPFRLPLSCRRPRLVRARGSKVKRDADRLHAADHAAALATPTRTSGCAR